MSSLSTLYNEAVISLVQALKIDEGTTEGGVPNEETKDAQIYVEANEVRMGNVKAP